MSSNKTIPKKEIVPMTLEQIVELINKTFIIPANSDKDYEAIMKTVKGSMFMAKEFIFEDGRYKLHRGVNTGGPLMSFRSNTIWVQDIETNKFFRYKACSFKKLRNSVKGLIASKKAGI